MKKQSLAIQTDRLVLRPLCVDDLHTTHAYASDYENTKLMVYLPNIELADTLDFLKKAEAEWEKDHPSYLEFAVTLEGKHIGAVSLYLEEFAPAAELGWIIHKQYQRKGYTYEAAQAVIQYAIEKLGIRHFIAHCDSENVPSYKMMEKLGMKKTDTHGGRKNKSSDEERIEFRYEMTVTGN